MLENLSDDDDVGVVIVAKRSGRGVPGSIEKPPCRIWIQRTIRRRRRSGSRGERDQGKGNVNEEKKEE